MKISKMNRPNIESWGSSALYFRDVSGLFVFNFPEILILLNVLSHAFKISRNKPLTLWPLYKNHLNHYLKTWSKKKF